jgi:hypothetical protein
MSIFNAIIGAGADLITAVVTSATSGIVNILEAAAAMDVGTIVVVVAILIIAKKVNDKINNEKRK